MDRKQFLQQSATWITVILINQHIMATRLIAPREYYFKDDGSIPNNKYPLLIYNSVFSQTGESAAKMLEDKFAALSWTNSWRWGVYPFHHYHSNTHEVLGVFIGNALLHMGGEQGEKIEVKAGDVIVIPAGVGHKCISHSENFTVVGAYPNGLSPDLNRGEKGERPKTDQNIAAVPLPKTDPVTGKNGGLLDRWK